MNWRRVGFVARVAVLFGVLAALWPPLRMRAAEAYDCRVEWLSSQRVRVTLVIHDYNVVSVKNRIGEVRSAFRMRGTPNTMEKGSPSLPYVAAVLPTPSDGASVRVVEAMYEALPAAPPQPSRGSVVAGTPEARMPFEEGAAYRDTAVWPHERVAVEPWGERERALRLQLYPFRYDPQSGSVLMARRMTVEVSWSRRTAWTASPRGGRRGAKARGEAVGRGQLLVIYAKMFENTLQDFLHFKRMAGLTVSTASFSAAGDAQLKDTAEIGQYIKQVYGQPGSGLRYVLFVGDFSVLPSRRYIGLKYPSTVSDWLYSPISPRFGEGQVAFGRLPAATVEELQRMLAKIASYEHGNFQKDAWLVCALGIASGEPDLGYGARSDAQHMEYLGEQLRQGGFARVENLLDDAAGEKVRVSDVVKAVNGGVGVVNYIGHGLSDSWKTSGMVTADARALGNRGMWPFVISAACDNGMRRGAEASFAEGWLLAHDDGAPTGAIAFVGATDNILWEEPMLAQEQMNMLLLQQGTQQYPFLTIGDIFTLSLVKMFEAYGHYKFLQQSTDVWHLFGDPSMPFRSATIHPYSSQLPRMLTEGMRQLPVQCGDEGSVVTLCRRREGVAPRYVSATSREGRALLVDLDLRAGDAVELAVVRANGKMQWVKELSVLPSQEQQLLAYSSERILQQEQQDALEQGGGLELTVEVVNTSALDLRTPLPLHLDITPVGALELLPESSGLSVPPIGAGESLRDPLRFLFKVNDLKGTDDVRIKILVEGYSGRKLLVDRTIPYRSTPSEQQEIEEHTLLVAPNPTAGAVRLRVWEGIASVRIYTLLGSCVLDFAGNSRQEITVDAAGLANGIYFVMVESVDGVIMGQKLVVNR